MSLGAPSPESSAASEPVRPHPALGPGMKSLGFSVAAAFVLACVFYFGFLRRHEGVLPAPVERPPSSSSRGSSSDAAAQGTLDAHQAERDSSSAALRQELAQVRQTLAEAQAAAAALRQSAHERRSDLAVARAKTTRVHAEGRQTRQRIDALLRQRTAWKTKFEPLLTDDRGRRIAGSPPHAGLALPVLLRPRAADDEIAGWSAELDELLQPLDVALRTNDAQAVVSDEHAAAVAAITRSVRSAEDELERDVRLLETLMEETQSLVVGAATLRDAARAAEVAAAARLRAAVDESRQAALAAQAETLRKGEQERLAAETRVKQREQENETARLRAREESLIALARDEEVQRQAAVARERLEREFARDLPEIRRLLSAFVEDGFQVRGAHQGKGPMSYAAIVGAGAMQRTPQGRDGLAILVLQSDRPSGPLPRAVGNQTRNEQDLCTRAQELLAKYGLLLIEKKLLAE